MTIINRVLNRLPEEKEDLLEGMKEWPDALPGAWYYLAVQEATNSHAYEGKGEVYERWSALNVNPDWAQYQRCSFYGISRKPGWPIIWPAGSNFGLFSGSGDRRLL